ncbi:MAG: dihydropteroate synthase [Candidatus Dormibacteria bacterium]
MQSIGGTGALSLLAVHGAAEAFVVEGLRSDQARALERAVRESGGITVISEYGERALLLASVASLAASAARLAEWGQQTEALGTEISRILLGQHTRAPMRCGSHTLDIGTRTLVMGVVNVTPDSFSGDGTGDDVNAAVDRAVRMVDEGAAIIDVGGESTRPHSAEVPDDEERRRVLPVIERLAGRLTVPLSIDTRKATVARDAVAAGCLIVNDIWGLRGDPDMAALVATNPQILLITMHNQRGTEYTDLLADIARSLRESMMLAARHGIAAGRIIVDPGFGFGKTPGQNLELVRRLAELRGLGRPLLLGASRKSTIGLVLDSAPTALRVEGGIALAVLAAASGADIIRTHDVAATVRALRVADAVQRGAPDAVVQSPAPGPTQ